MQPVVGDVNEVHRCLHLLDLLMTSRASINTNITSRGEQVADLRRLFAAVPEFYAVDDALGLVNRWSTEGVYQDCG